MVLPARFDDASHAARHYADIEPEVRLTTRYSDLSPRYNALTRQAVSDLHRIPRRLPDPAGRYETEAVLPDPVPPAAGWEDVGPHGTFDLAFNVFEANRRLARSERIATSQTASLSERRKAASESRFLRGYIEDANEGIRASSAAWLPELAASQPVPQPQATFVPATARVGKE